MSANHSPAMRRVMESRSALIFEAPFFGSLSLRLKLVEDPSCETAWTDGVSLGFNPDFVLSLPAPELKGTTAHEVMHPASGHHFRRGGREIKRWNRACDFAINGLLLASGFVLPKGALVDSRWTGKSAEWIYDRLPATGQEGNGAPDPAGEVRDAPSGDDSPGATEADWKQAVQQAANVVKARGELPGALERFASASKDPAVDWRSILQRFAQSAAKEDYSWKRPNVRYLGSGLYMPSLRSEKMGRMVVIQDISGSIDQVCMDQSATECQTILDTLLPECIEVFYVDTAIRKREIFYPGDTIRFKSMGGGGTDFRPAFAALEEDPPVCAVYLTDLEGRFPEFAPDYPVLWGSTLPGEAPFGETVYIGG